MNELNIGKTVGMNFKNILLSENSQTQKSIYHITPFVRASAVSLWILSQHPGLALGTI